jgi:hypothetical protein
MVNKERFEFHKYTIIPISFEINLYKKKISRDLTLLPALKKII